MIQNLNPSQQMYVPPSMIPAMQNYAPQVSTSCTVPCQIPQAGVMPVYNNIPYNPVYGNMSQPQSPHAYSPKISTVSIELNGLEPPKVPGQNDFQGQTMPMYPGMTQMHPQYQTMPQYYQPIEAPPLPVTAYTAPPPPQYIQQPQQAIVPPPPAVEQTPQAAASSTQQQDQEAVKPLLEALNSISSKQGAPELTPDQQEKAIQTIAQFARVVDAVNQNSKTDPSNPTVKQAKESVDSLIKPNLIKEDTFLALANIATKDTSSLTGEDKKKADGNKILGMWTLAMLQKLFKQDYNEEAKKINISPISMTYVPGIVQIADIVKKDPNPEIRESGIAALISLADPQDKKDAETMRAILGEAQKDSADNVKNAATEALKIYAEQKQQ